MLQIIPAGHAGCNKAPRYLRDTTDYRRPRGGSTLPFAVLDDEVEDRAAAVLPRVESQLDTLGLDAEELVGSRHGRRLTLGASGKHRRLFARSHSEGWRGGSAGHIMV